MVNFAKEESMELVGGYVPDFPQNICGIFNAIFFSSSVFFWPFNLSSNFLCLFNVEEWLFGGRGFCRETNS